MTVLAVYLPSGHGGIFDNWQEAFGKYYEAFRQYYTQCDLAWEAGLDDPSLVASIDTNLQGSQGEQRIRNLITDFYKASPELQGVKLNAGPMVPELLEAMLIAEMLEICISRRRSAPFLLKELRALRDVRQTALLATQFGLEKPIKWADIVGQLAEEWWDGETFGDSVRAVVETFEIAEECRARVLSRLSDLELSV